MVGNLEVSWSGPSGLPLSLLDGHQPGGLQQHCFLVLLLGFQISGSCGIRCIHAGRILANAIAPPPPHLPPLLPHRTSPCTQNLVLCNESPELTNPSQLAEAQLDLGSLCLLNSLLVLVLRIWSLRMVHHKICKYHQTTSNVCSEVLDNLRLVCMGLHTGIHQSAFVPSACRSCQMQHDVASHATCTAWPGHVLLLHTAPSWCEARIHALHEHVQFNASHRRYHQQHALLDKVSAGETVAACLLA